MSFWTILGSAAGEGAAEVIKGTAAAVGSLAKDIRSAITGELSPEVRARLEELALRAEAEAKQAQAAINLAEAQHASVFVAGWRPAIGWVAVVSMAAYYPPRFIVATTLWALQVWNSGQWVAPPEVGIGDLMALVTAMLGLASLRTYEKRHGVESNH